MKQVSLTSRRTLAAVNAAMSALALLFALIQAVPSARAQDAAQPILELSAYEASFGVVDDDGLVTVDVAFRNAGTAPLQITRAKRPVAIAPTSPNALKAIFTPGESGVLKLAFSPRNRKGNIEFPVVLDTNDPSQPQVRITLKGEVRPTIRIEPESRNVGEIVRGSQFVQKYRVTSRKQVMLPTEVIVRNPALIVRQGNLTENTTGDEKLWTLDFEVEIPADFPYGKFDEPVIVGTTDPLRRLQAHMIGRIVQDMRAVPEVLYFGQVRPGVALRSTHVIKSSLNKSTKILGARVTHMQGPAFLRAALTPRDGGGLTLSVTGDAPTEPGTFKGEIVLDTDDSTEPLVIVPYMGTVEPPK
jgi:hypothetical protein